MNSVRCEAERHWAGLAGATTVAFLLRWHFAGEQSLGYEEVFTRTIVHQPTVTGVWDATRATESTPPAYYLLVWLWLKLTGTGSAAGLRAVSVIGSAPDRVARAYGAPATTVKIVMKIPNRMQ